MHPPTYSRRVQEVLSDLAKDNKDAIKLSDLISRVRMRSMRSSNDVYSPFRKHLRAAVIFEIDSGRLVTDLNAFCYWLTYKGMAFYTALVLPPLPQRTRPSRARPSVKAKAMAEYRQLSALLQPIKAVIEARTFGDVRRSAVDNLPTTIRGFIDSIDVLCGENSDISSRLFDLSWELDAAEATYPDGGATSSTHNILDGL